MAKLPRQLAEQIKNNAAIEQAIRDEVSKKAGGPDAPHLRAVENEAPASSEPNDGGTPPTAEPSPAPVGEGAGTQQGGDAPLSQPSTPATPSASVPDAVAAGAGEPSDDPDSETWQHKYNVLNGKYVAEVPRMARDLAAANHKIDELTAQIQEMQQAPPPAAAPPPPGLEQEFGPLGNSSSFITSEETKEFGDDMVAFAKNAAKEVLAEHISSITKPFRDQISTLQTEVSTLKSQTANIADAQTTNSRTALYNYLNEHVAGWEAQNADPHFLGWLSQPDPLSGEPRRDMLNRAFARNDAQRVATFFNTFKQENAALTQAVQTSQQAPRQERTPPVDVNALVTPAPASGGGQPAPADTAPAAPGRVITGAEIKQFYADSQRGYYDRNPEAYKQREAEIKAAIAQGRVSP